MSTTSHKDRSPKEKPDDDEIKNGFPRECAPPPSVQAPDPVPCMPNPAPPLSPTRVPKPKPPAPNFEVKSESLENRFSSSPDSRKEGCCCLIL